MRWIMIVAALALMLAACAQTTVIDRDGTDVVREVPVETSVQYEGEPDVLVVYEEPDAGRAVFAVTDAPVTMSSVNELWVTVDQVEIHSETRGWVTVTDEEHRYDLLQLREDDEVGILADAALQPDTYQQVRLSISDVEVIDDEGTHDVVIPSGTLRFTSPFTIGEDELTYVLFDFDLANSLHITGNDRYVLTPVIRVLVSENAALSVTARERIVIREGTPREVIVVGTDVEGNVGPNRMTPINVNVQIEERRGRDVIIVRETTNVTVNQTGSNTTARTNATVNMTG